MTTTPTATGTPTLPEQFRDLDPYDDWVLEGERARYQKRLASSMEELQTFYDAAFPRLEEACSYLDQRNVHELTEEERNLLWLFCSLCNVSFPIEVWRQQRVPDSGAADVYAVVEPAI
jgi:hypothetical protein